MNAQTICSGVDFRECVALPLWASLRDSAPPSMPIPALASVTPAAAQRAHEAIRSVVRVEVPANLLGGTTAFRGE